MSSKATKEKHIHKLKRHSYKTGVKVFFCILPDCHFKIETPLALGKESICHICGNVFIMNERSVHLARPHCVGCGRKEIKIDGKKTYVRIQSGKVINEIAADGVSDLRSRLNSLTQDPTTEDI